MRLWDRVFGSPSMWYKCTMFLSARVPLLHDDVPSAEIVPDVMSWLGNALAAKKTWNADKAFVWGLICNSAVNEDKESNRNYKIWPQSVFDHKLYSLVWFVLCLYMWQHTIELWRLITGSHFRSEPAQDDTTTCSFCLMFTVDLCPFPPNICTHKNVPLGSFCHNTSVETHHSLNHVR